MSISNAQMLLQVGNVETSVAPKPSTAASASTARPTAESPVGPSAPAPMIAPTTSLSTDLRIDNDHKVYYQFVDQSTGNVVFEIPPEALRAIRESLNVPVDGVIDAHSVDVKS